jgi:hypothetical protein
MAIDLSNLLWPDADQGRQPQGPSRAAPIPGLILATNFLTPGALNLVTHELGTPIIHGAYGTQLLGVGASGVGVGGAGPNAGAISYSKFVPLINNGNFTIIAAGTWASQNTNRRAVVFIGDESVSPYEQISLCLDSDHTGTFSAGRIGAFQYNGGFGVEAESTSTSIVNGNPNIIALQSAGSTYTLWANGFNVTGTTSGGTAYLTQNYPIYINNTNLPSSGRGVVGATNAVLIFNRALSNGEMEFYTTPQGFWSAFAPPIQNIYPVPLSSGVSVTLTGQQAQFTAGTITPAVALSLTGQLGNFTAGTITPVVALALTGQQANFTAGTITYSSPSGVNVTLTGQAANFTAGTLTPASALSLTGQQANFTAGTLVPQLSLPLTGQLANFTTGTIVPELDIALTGQQASFTAGTIVYAGDVNVSLTGQQAIFTAGNVSYSGPVPPGGPAIHIRRLSRRRWPQP